MQINRSRNFLSTANIPSEQSKFKKFYQYGSIFWLFLAILVSIGKKTLTGFDPDSTHIKFIEGVLDLLIMVGIFGIPIIFFLSLFIRLVEYFINKIPAKEIK